MKINTKTSTLIIATVIVIGGIILTTQGKFLRGNFANLPNTPEFSPATTVEFAIIHPVTAAEDQTCSDTGELQFDISNPSEKPIAISRIGFYFQGEGFQNFAVSEIRLSPLNKNFSYQSETSLKEKSIAYFDLSPKALETAGLSHLTIPAKTTKSMFLSWKGAGEFQITPVYAKYADASAPAILPNGLQPLETIFIPKQNTWVWTASRLCML